MFSKIFEIFKKKSKFSKNLKIFEKFENFRKLDFSKIIEIPLKIEKSSFRKFSISSKNIENLKISEKFFEKYL